MRTSSQPRAVRALYLSTSLFRPPEGVERQRDDLLPGDLDGAEVAGPRHDPPLSSGGLRERPGVLGAYPAVELAADVGDRAEGHRGGMAAGVQEAVGGPEDGAEEEISRPPEGGHAPRPLEEMGGDVLEHRAGHQVRPAQGGVGPGAAGAHSPHVQGEVPRPSPQGLYALLHVAVEEPLDGAAAAEAREVEDQGVVAGGAEGLEPSPQIEVGLSPDQPRREQEDGPAGALRRKPGRRQRAGPAPPWHGQSLERRQILPGNRLLPPGPA